MFSSLLHSFYTKNKKRDREQEDDSIDILQNRLKQIKIDTHPFIYPVETYKKKLLYRNDNIQILYDRVKDSFSMVATKLIPKGTLLCIEEAFIGSGPYLIGVLQYNPNLAKELYPRKKEEFTTPASLLHYTTSELLQKINHNSWEWYSEKTDPLSMQSSSGLCPFISKCNHSCTPNAFTLKITNIRSIEEYTAGFVLYAVQDIEEKQEITISYGDTVGHLIESNSIFGWSCMCGLRMSQRCELLSSYLRLCKTWWEEDKDIINHY